MAIERRVFLSRVAWRLMFAAGAAALLAGCSDATRFSDPFSDPFQGSSTRSVDRAPTGTISRPRPEASRSPIQSSPLAPPQAVSQSAPPAPSAQPQASAGKKAGTYNHWSAEGGTPVVVADGETAGMIATRYGVPADALLRVNGFARPGDLHPGSRVVIPVYRATAATADAAPDVRAPAARTADVRDRLGKTAKTSGDAAELKNDRKSAAANSKSDAAKSASAQASSAKASAAKPKLARAADEDAKLSKAKGKSAQAEAGSKPLAKKDQKLETKRSALTEKREQTIVAAEAPARKIDKTPTASIPAQQEEKTATEAARPEFRWPARGRIIQGFNSGGNDGINISVPEGTQVKAAEGGVVAYAGSELKGYGNLVLIRHPNGFVSAYAHNGEIEVKRGDQVKRGQTIAKSGQSGNVGSPQLHFELRKGSTPVDPTNYLAGL